MKTTILPLSFLFLGLAVSVSAAGPQRHGGAPGCAAAGTCAVMEGERAAVVLTPEARAALGFQIEEERMAQELYLAFGKKWGARQFARIPRAEAHHAAMLRALATRAGLQLPEVVAGVFSSAVIQERYDSLLARGLGSEAEALAVGAAVERQDIADLQTLIASTDSAELKQLAQALAAASERHLAAFTGRRGGGAPRGRGGRS